jgi:ATP-dependent Zn protease
MTGQTRIGPVGAVALLILMVFLIVGLLYAYRAQSPAAREIAYSDAVARVQRGEVSRVTVTGNRAAIETRDGQRFDTVVPERDETLAGTILERNRAEPGRAVELRREEASPFPGVVVSVLLSLLPVVLLIALVFLAAAAFTRARGPGRYEQLALLADLRDRGAITEEEFQREKRKLLR